MKSKSISTVQVGADTNPVADTAPDNQQLIESHRKAAKHHEAAAKHHHQVADQHEKNVRINKEIHDAAT